MQSSAKSYQDHDATLLHWENKDEKELRKKLSDKNKIPTTEEYMVIYTLKIVLENGEIFYFVSKYDLVKD